MENRITDPTDLTDQHLKDLGVTVIGDKIAIQKHAKLVSDQDTKPHAMSLSAAPSLRYKPGNIVPPLLKADCTKPQFRKFKIDWKIHKQIIQLPVDQIAAHLYHSCDSEVQNSLIHSTDDIFTLSEQEIMELLESIVTKQANPSVHRLAFCKMLQSEGESIKDFVVRLKASARDCEFECPNCKHDLQPSHIRDQFIRGVFNTTLQTELLRLSANKNLTDLVKDA